MNINITAPQAKELAAKWELLSFELKAKVADAFLKAGYVISNNAKLAATSEIYNQPISASGYKRTGRLRDSISITNKGGSTPSVSIGPHTNYAIYVDQGTWKMPARPFMEDGLKNSKTEMDLIFLNLLNYITASMK